MYDELYNAIMKVDFEQAEKYFMKMSNDEQRDIITQLVYDTYSMIIYAFIDYINTKHESVLYHEMAFEMLANALCHIEGSYQMAYLHGQRLLELVPDSVEYLEWILSLYDVKVIDKEKALIIIRKIMEVDSDNINAKRILEKMH